MIAGLIIRATRSSTLMTVANLLVKSALILVVAPMGVRLLPQEFGITWTLSVNLVSLTVLFDLGISAIISRHVTAAQIADLSGGNKSATVHATARRVYRRLALLYAVVIVLVSAYLWFSSSIALRAGLQRNLLVTIVAGPVYLYFNYRYAILVGRNQVAMVNRIQAVSGLIMFSLALACLAFGAQVLALLMLYGGLLLPANFYGREIAKVGSVVVDSVAKDDCRKIYSDVYRASFGVGASLVVYNLASYFYTSQFQGAPGLLSALLLFQLLRGISSFSQAPFHSQLPKINGLYAEGRWNDFLRFGFRRMGLALGIQFAAFIGFYFVTVNPATRFINILPEHSDAGFYWLLAAALFSERMAAMLLQLYTATGHVIWHVVNGLSGACQLILVLVLSSALGLKVFPVALVASVLLIQLPLVLAHLYRAASDKERGALDGGAVR